MEQEKKENMKSERGSITLFVLLAGLFLLIVIFSMYVMSQNKKIAQDKEIQAIEWQYQTNQTQMDDLYQKIMEQEKIEFDLLMESNNETSWKVSIKNIRNTEDISSMTIQYQKEGEATGTTIQTTSFILSDPGIYTIKLEDSKGKTSELKKVYAYVKKGLQLYYDGIQNTRSGNNPKASVWEDLSGNSNDGVYYNMNSKSGYYDKNEMGYVFLENSSYIQSKKNIGITGDSLYTAEAVMTPWKSGRDTNYQENYFASSPLWWGDNVNSTPGTSFIFFYDRNNNTIASSYIQKNEIHSNHSYLLEDVRFHMSYQKIRTGQLATGQTDYAKMNYNGNEIESTYQGSLSFTQNLMDSPVTVGRYWQFGGENRTTYGSVQAIRIYNRNLTEEEIKINSKIDQERFQL